MKSNDILSRTDYADILFTEEEKRQLIKNW